MRQSHAPTHRLHSNCNRLEAAFLRVPIKRFAGIGLIWIVIRSTNL
jgi:hypothetical protein